MIGKFFEKASAPSPERAEAILADLRARHDQAKAELAQAELDYGAAAIATEEGQPGAPGALRAARDTLAKARATVDELALALSAAQQRHDAAVRSQRESELDRRWRVTETALRERLAAFEAAEKAIGDLSAAVDALRRHGETVVRECPAGLDATQAVIGDNGIVPVIRLAMFKRGIRWAANAWPFDPTTVMPISQRAQEANEYVLQQRAKMRVVA